jgi:hypothetical protein
MLTRLVAAVSDGALGGVVDCTSKGPAIRVGAAEPQFDYVANEFATPVLSPVNGG